MKPIIVSHTHNAFLFYYQKHNLVYIIATKQEGPALLFSTFLEHVDRVLADYYGELNLESKVRSQFVYLYMVCIFQISPSSHDIIIFSANGGTD